MLELRYTPSTVSGTVSGTVKGSELAPISKLQTVMYAVYSVIIPYIASKLNDWQSQRGITTTYPLVGAICRLSTYIAN